MPPKKLLTTAEKELEAKENMQKITLVALSKAGFFNEAAFYGGTCLRLLHGLDRFSEDLDFSLLKKDASFTLEKYFPAIAAEFEMRGRKIEIKKKDKQNFGKVQSAFLKDNTDTYDLKFQTTPTPKIKIETDYLPPLGFSTENKIINAKESAITRAFTLPDLFAGKMHAILFRQWQTRVKGRDWYDFEWYLEKKVPLNFKHLQERTKEFNGIELTPELFRIMLENRIKSIDFEAAKADVLPFIKNKKKIENWSQEHFLNKSKEIILKEEKTK